MYTDDGASQPETVVFLPLRSPTSVTGTLPDRSDRQKPQARGVSSSSYLLSDRDAYHAVSRVIRNHLQRQEYAEIADLLKDDKTATIAAVAIRNEVGRWERILIWRAEGSIGRRDRRRERQARQEAARATEVQLQNAGGEGGVAGDFDDGSGDTIRIPDSTDDVADGRQFFDVEENRKWLADQQRRAEHRGA